MGSLKWFIFASLLFTVLAYFPRPVFSHSGRTDSSGCHNCYTSYCYGEYHCHNGGGGGGYSPPRPVYLLPPPVNPKSATWTYDISGDNWCNYDLKMVWDQPVSGDRFSIAPSKYAGSDPGPNVDTSALNFTLRNLSVGRWFINIKTGNSERWSPVSYWTVDLPKITPAFNVFIEKDGDSQYINYQIACMDRVEGPQEFIDFLNTHNKAPKGKILIPYTYASALNFKAWDKSNKEYTQTVNYAPVEHEAEKSSEQDSSGDVVSGLLFGSGVLVVGWMGLKKLIKLLA